MIRPEDLDAVRKAWDRVMQEMVDDWKMQEARDAGFVKEER